MEDVRTCSTKNQQLTPDFGGWGLIPHSPSLYIPNSFVVWVYMGNVGNREGIGAFFILYEVAMFYVCICFPISPLFGRA